MLPNPLSTLLTPILRGAGSLVSGVAGAARTGATFGAGMLAGRGGNRDNVIPFNSMARANLASNNPGAVTDNASANVSQQGEVANNNGRNTTVNANVLESSTDTLQDIESVLVDIKEELKDINKNTEVKETFTTKEKTEEEIKAGFSMPAIPQKAKNVGKGAIGGLAGLTALNMLTSNANAGEVNFGEVNATPQQPADFDVLDSTKAVKVLGNSKLTGGLLKAGGDVLTSKPVTTIANKTAQAGIDVAGRVALNASEGTGTVAKLLQKTKIADKVLDVATGPGSKNLSPVIAKIVATKGPGLVSRAIPFLGTVAGGVLGVKKLIEGDMVGAGLAATALAPGVGTVGTLGVAGYEIAREAYNEVHGQYPEGDPKVKERMPALLEEATKQVTEFVETEIKARAVQKTNLDSAKDSGLFDKDIIGNSEVNADMIGDATTGQLQAIIKDDDISDENKALITSELESRSNVTPLTTQPMVDSAPLQQNTEEVEELQSQPAEPIVINDTSSGNSGPAPKSEVSVNVSFGDSMAPDSQGSARFISRD